MNNALTGISSRFGDSFGIIEPHLQTALASAADPERSMVYLERLLDSDKDSLVPALVRNPRVIESLVTIFSGSQFLTEIILRNPKNVSLLYQRRTLTQRKSAAEIHAEAVGVIESTPAEGVLNALRLYQRAGLLRIGVSDLLA